MGVVAHSALVALVCRSTVLCHTVLSRLWGRLARPGARLRESPRRHLQTSFVGPLLYAYGWVLLVRMFCMAIAHFSRFPCGVSGTVHRDLLPYSCYDRTLHSFVSLVLLYSA